MVDRRELGLAVTLLAVSGFFATHLLLGPVAEGALVSTTTLPTACAVALVVLAVIMVGQALSRPRPAAGAPAGRASAAEAEMAGRAARWRVVALLAWTVLYVALMPWLGYLAGSAAYLAGLAWLYGNRSPAVVAALVVLVPLALLLFFERFMLVLLPSTRLLD